MSKFFVPSALFVVLFFLFFTERAEADLSPRLLANEQQLEQIRQAVRQPGTMHAEALAAMRARVDRGFDAYRSGWGPANPRADYLNSWWAREAALVYRLTGDRRYAETALRALRQTPDAGVRQMGLWRAQLSLGHAFAYDWAGEAWSEADRKWVHDRMIAALDAWPRFGHTNLGGDRGSNWAAITRGAELILLVGAREEGNRADRVRFLKNDLSRHIRSAYGSLGYTQEGLGYKSFTAHFLYPAALVTEQVLDDSSLADALRQRTPWRMIMYGAAFAYGEFDEARRYFPYYTQTSVSNPFFTPEGMTSVMWGFVSDEDAPYYKHFYDRLAGQQSTLAPAYRYDYSRAGATYALLLYPIALESKDPSGVWPAAVADNRGYYWYRNRWRDDQDTLGLIMADTNWHGRAWNNEEALSLGLFSHGTLFLHGPGTGARPEPSQFSTVLVDGNRPTNNRTGERVSFETEQDRAYIVVGGGAAYRALGLNRIHRHLLVDFTGRGGVSSLFSTLDRFEADGRREVAWHANLSHERAHRLRLTAGSESGRRSFLIRGEGDSYVKGWVLHPSNPQVAAGNNLAIGLQADKGDIWIVYVTGTGRPPVAQITGQGMQSRLTLPGAVVSFDAEKERVMVSDR